MYVELLEKAGYVVTVSHTSCGNEQLQVIEESGTRYFPISRLAGGGKVIGFYDAVEVQAKKFSQSVGLST